MRKINSIGVLTIAILVGVFTIYSTATEPTQETDSIITDKNGQVVEPTEGDDENFGH